MSMKILVRNDMKGAWKLIESAAYENESHLQHLLEDSPSLLSIDDVRPGAGQLVVAVREFPLPIGSLDLLAFSPDGDLALIECKLANNPQIKREVIGQALEYGAHLWQMSYEELDQKIKARKGNSLVELMRSSLEGVDWDEGAFRERIENSLESGNFILMIVVDEITEELARIIHFVNNCGRPDFSFAALEMQRFQSDTTEMLVPRVVADTFSSVVTNPGGRTRWTEASFLQGAEERLGRDAFQIVQDLYAWSQKNAYLVRFGTGSANGSFTFLYEREGKLGSVFSVYTDGMITINFGYMEKIFTLEEIASFRMQLADIETYKSIATSKRYYYNENIETVFANNEYLDQFKQIILGLKKLL